MDPVSAISLATTAGHLIKSIYGVYGDIQEAPRQLEGLCRELSVLQEALGRISITMQFPPATDSDHTLQRLATPEFNEMMTSTEVLLHDLLQQLAPPAKGSHRSFRSRIMWVSKKSTVEERLRDIERRKEYFTMVLSSKNLVYLQDIYSEVMSLSQQSTFELHRRLTVWLGTPDYHTQHTTYLTSRQPGTGSWFIEGPLTDWVYGSTSSNEILWLQGKSGCGKSLIASYAIESAMEASDRTPQTSFDILYFHCTFQDVSTQSLNAVLASLTQQMCEKRPELWSRVDAVNRNSVSGTRDSRQEASLDQLKQLFLEFSACFPRLYVFLDAPNESSDSAAIVLALGEAICRHPFMRLCIFSTPDLPMQSFISLGLRRISIEMNADKQKQDFETYIKSFLQNDPSLASLPDGLKSDIRQKLSSKADGSFRWVDCQLQSLVDQDSVAQVRLALDSLPPSLDKHYRDTLLKVPLKDRVRVRRLLRWLTVQTRPLTIRELSEAVVLRLDADSTVLDGEERLMKGKIELYLKAAGSLVQYDSERQEVKLAHASVQEFLLSPKMQNDKDLEDLAIGNYENAVQVVLATCLWYLIQELSRTGSTDSGHWLLPKWPLFDYCAQAWPEYVEILSARRIKLFEMTKQSIRRLLDSHKVPGNGNYGLWLQKYAARYVPKVGQNWTMLPPLHLAAGYGWLSLVQLILEGDKKDLDAMGGESRLTPLFRACCYHQETVVRYLLSVGANPAPQDATTKFKFVLSQTSPQISQLMIDALSKWRTKQPVATAGNASVPSTLRLPVLQTSTNHTAARNCSTL